MKSSTQEVFKKKLPSKKYGPYLDNKGLADPDEVLTSFEG